MICKIILLNTSLQWHYDSICQYQILNQLKLIFYGQTSTAAISLLSVLKRRKVFTVNFTLGREKLYYSCGIDQKK